MPGRTGRPAGAGGPGHADGAPAHDAAGHSRRLGAPPPDPARPPPGRPPPTPPPPPPGAGPPPPQTLPGPSSTSSAQPPPQVTSGSVLDAPPRDLTFKSGATFGGGAVQYLGSKLEPAQPRAG